jgi:4-amino-4-deoxy-L-arabinose transferase-like glycosyltransferase
MRVRARPDRFTTWLAVIVVAALVGRVAYVLWMRDRPVLADGFHYHFAAHYLADGLGFINPVTRALNGSDVADATHPPGWTVVLTLPTLLGLRSYLSHQVVACVVGAATVAMTGLAGKAAFGRRTGLLAAGLAAVYPNVWLYEREVLSEPLAMLGVATTIWLAFRFRAKPGAGFAVALGAAVGVMAMTRSELIAISVLLVVPLILSVRSVDWRRRVAWLVAAGVACIVVISPWAIYNASRFEKPVPLSAGLGAAMLTGNCGPTYHGRLLGSFELGCIAFVRDLDPDPSVADGQYREQALDFMNDNRSRVPVVVAARVGRTFGFFRPAQQMHFEAERGTALWVIRLAFVAFWILLPAAVAGAVRARRHRIPLYPLLAFPATVLLAVVTTIGAVRYRAPAEIPLVLLAAFAFDALIARFRRWQGAAASAPAAPAAPETAPVTPAAV